MVRHPGPDGTLTACVVESGILPARDPTSIQGTGNLHLKVTNIGVIGNPYTNLSSDPSAQWPGASGIYLFVVDSEQGQQRGKFVIIR